MKHQEELGNTKLDLAIKDALGEPDIQVHHKGRRKVSVSVYFKPKYLNNLGMYYKAVSLLHEKYPPEAIFWSSYCQVSMRYDRRETDEERAFRLDKAKQDREDRKREEKLYAKRTMDAERRGRAVERKTLRMLMAKYPDVTCDHD